MGLLNSVKALYSKLSTTSSNVLSKVASSASSAAARVDGFIPHPKNGGLQNVVDVLAAPFLGGRVTANVKNPTLKKGLELVSNNPFKTAAVGASVVTAGRAIAPSVAKTISPAIKKTGTLASSPPAQAARGGMISSAPAAPTMNGSPQSANGGIIKASSSTYSPRRSSGKRRTRTRRASGRSRRQSRSRTSRRTSKRRSKKRYGTAKQYARPGGRSVKYTKNGQPYIILASGKARFIKGRRRKR